MALDTVGRNTALAVTWHVDRLVSVNVDKVLADGDCLFRYC